MKPILLSEVDAAYLDSLAAGARIVDVVPRIKSVPDYYTLTKHHDGHWTFDDGSEYVNGAELVNECPDKSNREVIP